MRDYYSHSSRRRKVIRRRRIFVAILALLILAGIVFCIVKFLVPALHNKFNAAVQEPSTQTEAAETPPEPAVPVYDYSQPVPESEAVNMHYFDDAVFIGNSRTQGLILYNAMSSCISFATKGLSLSNVYTTTVTPPGAKSAMPMMDALQSVNCGKIYVMLGMNELSWPSSEKFQTGYLELIQKLKAAKPNTAIYIQSVLPLTKTKETAHPKEFTMARVNEYNTMLRKIALDEKVYYVDVSSGMIDSTGYLPESAATDGIHLTPEYCKLWLQYLQNHVVLPADYNGEYSVASATSTPAQQTW